MKGTILQTASVDAAFLNRVGEAADQSVQALLETHDADVAALAHRPAMGRLLAMVTVFTEPGSRFYGAGFDGAGGLRKPMAGCLDRLEQLQGPTGLFDGTNLCSPPDSAFTLNDVCLALGLIRALDTPPDPVLAEVDARLSGIVSRATDAMVAGGVHTPNHRW
jgi:hypothetical protein